MTGCVQCARAAARTRRRAFTLVEMMVVLVVVGILVTLGILIGPRLSDQRAAARGADQLQGWLLIAKSRALRDQAPRGVRLIPDSTNSSFVRQLEYVEQPANFRPVDASGNVIPLAITQTTSGTSVNPTASAQVQLSGFTEQGAIQSGDFLEVMLGTPRVYQITGDPTSSGGTLSLFPPILNAEAAAGGGVSTTNYQVVRRWRPLPGEPVLQMPNRVVIDIGKNSTYSRPLPTPDGSNIIVMFSPSGALLDAPANRAILWVRSEDNQGEPTLITVYSRTGGIAAHPVDTSNATNPYTFTADGLGSGL